MTKISGDKLADFKNNVGYKNLAFDLLGLVSLLQRWRYWVWGLGAKLKSARWP
jgi:hypothetical protein